MKTRRIDRVKALARMLTPPAVWLLARKVSGRA